MLFLLPNVNGVEVPGTVMKHIAPQIDPDAVILFGPEATPKNARKAIEELNPTYVFTAGHGIPCTTTLQGNEPFISLAEPEMNKKYCSGNRNLDLAKGRVFHIHSCWCGRLLAPVLVQKYGAKAVFAHDDEFLFLLPEDGKTIDLVVAAPFLAEFTVDQNMLAGASAGEAQEARMRAYEKWIEYFYHGEGSKLKGAPLVLRILVADKAISKLYGDPNARVAEQSKPREFRLSLPLEVEGGSKPGMAALLPLAFVFLGGVGSGKKGHNGTD